MGRFNQATSTCKNNPRPIKNDPRPLLNPLIGFSKEVLDRFL
jgi:hypothetical protein